MKCVIGKNSKIVNKLNLDPNIFNIVSHNEIGNLDFNAYESIFVFSWDYDSLSNNLLLLCQLPLKKVLFISTQSIFSLQLRKQWASYPNDKLNAENFVMNNGGSVVRLGTVESRLQYSFKGTYAFTDLEKLNSLIEVWDPFSYPKLINYFDIKFSSNQSTHSISNFFDSISRLLPSSKYFQIPLILLQKLCGINKYGYTSDCSKFVHECIQIGYGSFGSTFSSLPKYKNSLCLVSNFPNYTLNNSGFQNTKIGKRLTGLAAYWHGVTTHNVNSSNEYYKKVQLFVNRPSLYKAHYDIVNVFKINHDGSKWSVLGTDKQGAVIEYFSKNLVLAAGWLDNIKLLSYVTPISTKLDDDENFYAGTCNTIDAIKSNLIKLKFKIFITHNTIKRITTDKYDFIIDIRPHVPSKHSNFEGLKFYTANTSGILIKLVKGFNFNRINEAFFNKFGFAFYTESCSVFVQALTNNCISVKADMGQIELNRSRLSISDFHSISDYIHSILNSFNKDDFFESVDGLHVMGGIDIVNNSSIRNLISDGRLSIVGVPCKHRSDPFHTTVLFQKKIKSDVS